MPSFMTIALLLGFTHHLIKALFQFYQFHVLVRFKNILYVSTDLLTLCLIVFFHTSFCLFLLFSFFQINLGKFKWVKSWGSQRNNKARRASSKKIWVERGNKIQPHNKIISLISRSVMPPKSSRHKRRRAERRKTPVFPVSSHMGTHSSHEGSTRIA